MRASDQHAVLRRLRIARGHLDGVVRMVDGGAYCPEVMKQLSAVQGAVQHASRLVLRHHLETCVADAMRAGHTQQIVDELMEALRYDRGPVAPTPSAADSDSPDHEEMRA